MPTGARKAEMELVNQEQLDDGRIRIVVKAQPQQVTRAVDEVYRDLRKRVTMPGFRKGKAPRALLEQRLDIAEARQMALDDLAPTAVAEALSEAGIEPFSPPVLEQAEIDEHGAASLVAVVTPRPEVELGEYRGLEAVRPAVEVSEEQVETQIDRLRERYARYEVVTDRPAQEGDLALVDYDLVVDGEVVEAQRTQGYPCQIGSDTLFPELNQKLVGLKPGDEARIPARIPQDHTDTALAGKEGEYVVTLSELKQRIVPELTDEMARQAHSVDSAQELRELTRALLEELARQEAEDHLRSELLEKVVEASRVHVPPAVIRAEARARLERLEADLRAAGRSLDRYLDEREIDRERWLREEEMQVRVDLLRALVLEEIGRREGIEVTEEEIAGEIARIAERNGASVESVPKRLGERGLRRVAAGVRQRKVFQLLVDQAHISDEGGAAAPAIEAREGQP